MYQFFHYKISIVKELMRYFNLNHCKVNDSIPGTVSQPLHNLFVGMLSFLNLPVAALIVREQKLFLDLSLLSRNLIKTYMQLWLSALSK